MPRVSIVLPSYNHEKYVRECIQSVPDQRYQYCEAEEIREHFQGGPA